MTYVYHYHYARASDEPEELAGKMTITRTLVVTVRTVEIATTSREQADTLARTITNGSRDIRFVEERPDVEG